MADGREVENGPSEPQGTKDKISSADEERHSVTRNRQFSSQKEAQEYERKKANALLANPLRGYTHDELRQMGKDYALGRC